MRQRPAEPGGPRLGQPPHPPTPARAAIRLSWAHQSRSAAAWATCPTRNGRSQDPISLPRRPLSERRVTHVVTE